MSSLSRSLALVFSPPCIPFSLISSPLLSHVSSRVFCLCFVFLSSLLLLCTPLSFSHTNNGFFVLFFFFLFLLLDSSLLLFAGVLLFCLHCSRLLPLFRLVFLFLICAPVCSSRPAFFFLLLSWPLFGSSLQSSHLFFLFFFFVSSSRLASSHFHVFSILSSRSVFSLYPSVYLFSPLFRCILFFFNLPLLVCFLSPRLPSSG